jgi:glycerol-3-phosphate dehydrogenase (NAD(P)+)
MEAGFRSDVEFVMAHDHSNAALTAHMKTSNNSPDDKKDDADHK